MSEVSSQDVATQLYSSYYCRMASLRPQGRRKVGAWKHPQIWNFCVKDVAHSQQYITAYDV